MNNTAAAQTETTVTAETAPLGVQLWPTRSPEFAPNFTLDRVDTMRGVNGTVVRWVYQSGKERFFNLGEEVVVSI